MSIEAGGCEIWLTNDAEAVQFCFPVLPESYRAGYENDLKSTDLIGLGELVTKGGRPAVTVSFSTFFPGAPFYGMTYEWQDPKTYLEALIGYKNSKYPSHLIITNTLVNFYCFIDKLDVNEGDGDVGTIYVDISFKEFRQVEPRQVEIDPITQVAIVPLAVPTRTDNRKTPSTVVFGEGDSLQDIARKVYGDETRWKDIFDLNSYNIPHPMLVPIGTVLQMPEE